MPLLLSPLAFALPSFDPFADATASGGTSYAVGSTLTNQFNPALYSAWYSRGGNFPGTTPLIVAGSLSYPGLPASTGNSASFAPASSTSACLDLSEPAGGQPNTVYASFLLKITDISVVPTTAANNAFVGFIDDPSHSGNQIQRLGTRVLAKKVGSGYVLGTSMNQYTTNFVYEASGNAHNVGDVLFVVQAYLRNAGVQTNVFLWVNPPSSSFGSNAPPAPTLIAPLTPTANTALNNDGARGFALLCQYANAPSGVIDDVRFGTDWATVTGGPGLYASPSNQTFNAAATATLSVGAFGGTPLSYQWQKNGANLSDGSNISGATTSILTISNILSADAASYDVVVSNSYNVVTSAVDVLTVNDPWITTQPTNETLNIGGTAMLQVAALGTPALTYQWYQNSNPLSDGGRISGSQTNKLTITGFTSGDAGTYYVMVYNGNGSSITSSNALLLLTDPSIVGQPQSVTNLYGTTATFQVTPSGTAPFSYQWHEAGVGDLSDTGNISGSRTNLLSISGVSYTDAGTYSVTVTNSLGSVDSAPAVLTVLDPAITNQPVSTTNVTGSTATFHVGAIGTPGLNYVWYQNTTILFDDGVKYAGSSTDTLSISNVASTDQSTYSVVVLNGGGLSVTSSPVTLTAVSPPAPINITEQPTPRKVLAGSKTVVAVGYTGSSPQFQWQFGGTNIPGATAAAYILTNVQPAVTGNYQVIVSNSLNVQTSSPAAVAIIASLHLYPTNIAVLRVGDGAEALTTHGNSISVDQFAPDGTYLTTMSLPDGGPTSVVAIGPTVVPVGANTSVTGNNLSRSANGRFLVFGAYNTNLSFASDLQSANATTVPRGIGLIDDQAQYTLAISSSSAGSGNFWRGAAFDGTNDYWGFSRTAGTYYFGFDVPGLVVQSDWSNLRSMAIFNGRLYAVSAVAGKTGVARFAGLPEAPETVEVVINTGSSFSSDCEVSPDGTVVYVADSEASGTGGGVQRWQFDGSNWNLAYTLNDNLPGGAYYVTADFSGANPVVYAVTTDAENNQIVRISDAGSGSPGTVVAYAGASQNFRGIRLGPAATTNTTRPLLSETAGPGNVTLNWSGSFFLQSSLNATGVYSDVINGTRPYTNSSTAGQKFFRLRQ
ncbi:MAG TPA: immunoglobulin domain-containing protein [Candidatus Acidoferrum sp.]|nr:immunoglobulin domain-containing protein [Candidatus Acidoferrum sp.]